MVNKIVAVLISFYDRFSCKHVTKIKQTTRPISQSFGVFNEWWYIWTEPCRSGWLCPLESQSGLPRGGCTRLKQYEEGCLHDYLALKHFVNRNFKVFLSRNWTFKQKCPFSILYYFITVYFFKTFKKIHLYLITYILYQQTC